ncbi:UNVERIFIED_CONTAM: Early nodulin-like protein 3 [Sesamum radiatum]|uniref:Early nodulin-like protein 3 n=1 Tax=Sesamum radiatum TaxID=300843 RepID=A0AAW2T3E5_SESRA
MAGQDILRVDCKRLWVLGVVSVVVLMIQKGNAFQFKVGGSGGSWTVPADPSAAIYNQWAEKHRFQIGDSLLFVYDADHDSVLHVTKDDYTNCNTAAPLEKFSDGHTVFTFNQSGPYYFISGSAVNCHKNEKLVVVVMADRSQRNSNQPVSSPPPPPPQESSPPKNAASSSIAGILGTIAAFVGSSLLSVI